MERYKIKEDSNVVDIVLWYFPEMDNDDIEWVLGCKTCFPFGGMEDVEKGVYLYYIETKIWK